MRQVTSPTDPQPTRRRVRQAWLRLVLDGAVLLGLFAGAVAAFDWRPVQAQDAWVIAVVGLTGALGTVAEHVDGVYTGALVGDMLHGPAKGVAIQALAEREGLDLNDHGERAYNV